MNTEQTISTERDLEDDCDDDRDECTHDDFECGHCIDFGKVFSISKL